MKYVYIAGPYTHDDPVLNTSNVIDVAEDLAKFGYIPYAPHLTMFWHFLYPHDIEFWYEYDLAWLLKCDCVLRIDGDSHGADNEVEFAKTHDIPVFYTYQELTEYNWKVG